MRRFRGWFAVSAVVGMVLLATVARSDDKKADDKKADDKPKAEKIAPDKLPKAVMDAIKGRFPGADITSAEKEKEGDKIVFDVELKHKDRKYEMDIEENGTIIEIEKEIKGKEIPEKVTKALEAKYPKSTVKEVMEVYKVKGKEETLDSYEATIETADKKTLEVIVSLDGKEVKPEK